MNIENRIKHYRKMRGMTQDELGIAAGFPPRSAGNRICQLEENRGITPKAVTLNHVASALHVSPFDISAHVFSCCDDLARSLLMLEETGLFEIEPEEDHIRIQFVNPEGEDAQELLSALQDAMFDRSMYSFLENTPSCDVDYL